jgi:hypothetical protein
MTAAVARLGGGEVRAENMEQPDKKTTIGSKAKNICFMPKPQRF